MILVYGCLPRLLALRARIAEALVEFDLKNLDSLEDYTAALSFAHAQFMTGAESTEEELKQLYIEAVASRDRLHPDVTTLSARGRIAPAALKHYKGRPGYRRVAFPRRAHPHLRSCAHRLQPRPQRGPSCCDLASLERERRRRFRPLTLEGPGSQARSRVLFPDRGPGCGQHAQTPVPGSNPIME